MKIALIGASGYTGSRILSEALARGHQVTAILRDPGKLRAQPDLRSIALDVIDTDALAAAIDGHPVVISAFNPGKDEGGAGVQSILAAVRQHAGMRLLIVGGAGSLEVAPGMRLVDQPDFPMQWKDGALKTAAVLDTLRQSIDLDWTFISPAAALFPGQRTGFYRTGGNALLRDQNGDSRISVEDYAVAMIDEVESGAHPRQRISVAY